MKIKKILAACMAVTIVGGVLTASPQIIPDYSITASAEFDDDGNEYTEGTYESLTYWKYSDHVVISRCDSESEGEIVIPSEIEGLPVTKIGVAAFRSCHNLKTITLPNSITSIGIEAFAYCTSLKSITIPDNVTIIGEGAFGVCENLETITIPDNIIEIGYNAFYGTKWLENKQKENPLVIVNNMLIDGIACTGDVVIPDGVTSIGDYAFYWCVSLESITIPDSVTSIGAFAFQGCDGLESITIPGSVTSIGEGAFIGTKWLENKQKENPFVVVNNMLIDGRACVGDVVIPDSVTSIGYTAFKYCSSLKSITFPNSVTSIDCEALYWCDSLESVTILNPDCDIYDDEFTISSEYNYDEDKVYFNGTICGYEGSTAQAYAEKYNRKFESLGAAPENPGYMLGDTNGDGAIDAADASNILALYAKLSTSSEVPTAQEWLTCDVNKDEAIDATDAAAVLSYYAYTSTENGDMSLEEFIKN